MSQIIEVKVPDIGDFSDVPVIDLFVKVGDTIKVDDAIEDFDSALRISPDDVNALIQRGFAYGLKKDFGSAFADNSRALEIAPDNPTALFYRGQIESLRGNLERALEDYNAAQRLQPDNPRTYAARAAVYLELGDYDSAIDDLDQAIKLRPKDATQYLHRGIAYFGKGDWARTVLRQFFFSTYQFYLYRGLQNSKDATLSAIAEKAIREVTYHLRWSAEWVIRLGDGTTESHGRMMNAVNDLWAYTGELLTAAPYETTLAQAGIAVDPSSFKDMWLQKVREVLEEATLSIPENNWMQTGGKAGLHTEHLGYVLSELQFMQRTYPGCEW